MLNYLTQANLPSDYSTSNSFTGQLNAVRQAYLNFLNQYTTTLGTFKTSINDITGKLKEFTGDDNGLFSFIQCSFIKINLKIILKYLKSAFGKDILTVGICLIVVGCSLALSISTTILMIIIINFDNYNRKNGQIRIDLSGGLVQYK